jgi:hypothetical protein
LQTQGADPIAANPDFLRLFYSLAIEGQGDPVAGEIVRRVHSPRNSSAPPIYARCMPTSPRPPGARADGDQPRSSTASYDRVTAAELWCASIELAGLGHQEIRRPSAPK